ncbi:hypothetical protein OG339_13915 [Streptosporangium sp. NBC_01495]|uniref:hypothetical protein n=1 Tax=Streptosporangium sp. NBC_01495 TaxID=2903899 RepID=UPI002E2EC6BC|nr:hypothetical protein [Streptosporangium sp. NBC_01495]
MRRVVVDPEVPPRTADLFRRHASMLSRIRAGWSPEPPPPNSRLPGRFLNVGGGVAALFLVCLMFLADVGQLLFFMLALLVFVVFVGLLAAREPAEPETIEHELYREARWYEGRYLLPAEDFDYKAGQLLDRTQQAIDYILRSRVNAMGMLDSVRNSVMLPSQEWEIARLLTKLSTLRNEHHEFVYGGSTPEVAAAMAPLERALAASEAAVLARVEALERYAGHVADAERALRAHDQIEALRARLPRYEELLAESGADVFAVPEIGRLAEDAGHLEQALRDSVRSAHEAFRHLDGPPGGSPPSASGPSAGPHGPPDRGDGPPASSSHTPTDPFGFPPFPGDPAEEPPAR